ncbi:MAG: GIY-YIG nuclease family protein [Spirochaetota bacterium]|nr:GIY-YIG nuclease family protein [Spirochaetota bacterium]
MQDYLYVFKSAIYILTNKDFKNRVKIGMTKRSIEDCIKKLNSTRVSQPF